MAHVPESEDALKAALAPAATVKKAEKDSSSEDSSDDGEEKKKKGAKKAADSAPAAVVKPAIPTAAKRKAPAATDSSSDSSDDEKTKKQEAAKPPLKKAVPAEKADSSDDDSSSDEEETTAAKKSAPAAAKQAPTASAITEKKVDETEEEEATGSTAPAAGMKNEEADQLTEKREWQLRCAGMMWELADWKGHYPVAFREWEDCIRQGLKDYPRKSGKGGIVRWLNVVGHDELQPLMELVEERRKTRRTHHCSALSDIERKFWPFWHLPNEPFRRVQITKSQLQEKFANNSFDEKHNEWGRKAHAQLSKAQIQFYKEKKSRKKKGKYSGGKISMAVHSIKFDESD